MWHYLYMQMHRYLYWHQSLQVLFALRRVPARKQFLQEVTIWFIITVLCDSGKVMSAMNRPCSCCIFSDLLVYSGEQCRLNTDGVAPPAWLAIPSERAELARYQRCCDRGPTQTIDAAGDLGPSVIRQRSILFSNFSEYKALSCRCPRAYRCRL